MKLSSGWRYNHNAFVFMHCFASLEKLSLSAMTSNFVTLTGFNLSQLVIHVHPFMHLDSSCKMLSDIPSNFNVKYHSPKGITK